MVSGITTALAGAALLAAAIAYVALARLAALRRRFALLEKELEHQQDAAWRAEEREESARTEGRLALAEALAGAEAAARAKAKFLATVAHEMRTPLSGVIGATELLLDTALAPDQRTYAVAVKQSAEAMLTMVDESLDLSRIDADRLVTQDAPFGVAELVEGVAELLAPRAQAKGLDLAVMVGAGAPTHLLGDASRIRQILLNLAGNAIKFTTRGGVGLRVDVDAEEARFSVGDTGPGFDPSETERLFSEFEQGAEPTAGGVGLGLAISRKLAHAMGGALTASSTPGEGSTFLLALPLRATNLGEPTLAPSDPLVGRRILVVSGGPFSGPWLVERMQDWGAEASLAAPDADVAMAAVGHDTVLIDRPGTTGAAGLAAAARHAGASRVLLMLSPAERGELPTLAADGFDGYLVKPVRAASLIHRLEDPRAHQTTSSAEPVPPVSFPNGTGLRVLLAEDDPVSALIALAHLARLGHSAEHVPDGVSACSAFENQRFDAVLLDLRMPGLDGCEVARRMRTIEANEGRPPALLLALTADVADDDCAATIEAGVNAVLIKPLDPKALAALLERSSDHGFRVAQSGG